MGNLKLTGWGIHFLMFLGICACYGCGNVSTTITPSITLDMRLTPYQTQTAIAPSGTPSPISISSTFFSQMRSPTPTPFLYKVISGDTFTSIAYKHGVKLNDLISANPEINPNFLSIGVTITIPITGTGFNNLLAPTPIPLTLHDPICYKVLNGGRWCLVKVENSQGFDVENVSARINLYSTDLLTTTSQTAITPLNILPQGKSTLLASFFPPPLPENILSWTELISVIPIQNDSQRYLALEIINQEVEFSDDKGQAIITGDISLLQEDQKAERIWILAIAYDESGQPVGFRKWEAQKTLISGEQSHFELIVSSLGPPIDLIDLLFEARP